MNLKKFQDYFLFALSFLICVAVFVFSSSADAAQEKVDFVNHIKPIFEKHCVSCHGPVEPDSFRIDDSEDALAYIEPGDAEESDLYLSLVSDDEEELMPPPEENDPLSDSQIQFVKTWINQGAEWPEGVQLEDTSDGAIGTVSGDDKEEVDPEAAAAAKAKTQQIFNAIGSLHPAAIHLPIGLLLAAGLFAFFSLRGNFVMSDCAYYCLWLGTIGAIVACVTGWWFSPMENRGTVVEFADLFNQEHKVFWHRTGGLVVTAVAFLLALFAAGARNRDPDDGILWKLGLIVLAGGIGWVGHTGGELHYGEKHYKDLQGLYQDLVTPKEGAPNAEPDADDANNDTANNGFGEMEGDIELVPTLDGNSGTQGSGIQGGSVQGGIQSGGIQGGSIQGGFQGGEIIQSGTIQGGIIEGGIEVVPNGGGF